jgi:adenine-specific DNA-methyltransferase
VLATNVRENHPLGGGALAHIHELLRQLRASSPANAAFADDMEREVDALSNRRAFGLNFERHTPEEVELPGRPVRTSDKVHVLPLRGALPTAANSRLWRVTAIEGKGDGRVASLEMYPVDDLVETASVALADLVVVAEFRDPIYPGLVSTGRVERGGDKPFHSVINAENFHALQTLLFTQRGKVDAIYIDPPYNSGARDWKYSNDYVESEDLYRHSKWLAFMERRLLIAKQLLNPEESVLIVTIDENEYLRVGLLLEQIFPEASTQMVSSVTNPAGAGRSSEFARTDEYIFFLRFGRSRVLPEQRMEERRGVTWDTLRRSDFASRRGTPKGGTGQFYPFYINKTSHRIESIGEPLPHGVSRDSAPQISGCIAVFPVRPDETEMNWGITAPAARDRLARGYIRVGKSKPIEPQQYVISYLTGGIIEDIDAGNVEVSGRATDGSVIAHYVTGREVMPTTNWNRPSHDAQRGGTSVTKALMPDRRFPFPKSLYAIEDCLRFFVKNNPDAVILDFFAGSGTTAHAVMRLNRQDEGRRQSILVTNNEVSAEEQKALREAALRPGDPEWERWGICDYITKPRLRAAITGQTPDGKPIKGDYKFTDEVSMADGFDENVEFFTMTYEAPLRLRANRDFEKVAPLLWLRAGSRGSRIDSMPGGWAVADAYGVLADLDQTDAFVEALNSSPSATVAFIITDDDSLFEAVALGLPVGVEPIRMYDAYLRNFEIDAMRGER